MIKWFCVAFTNILANPVKIKYESESKKTTNDHIKRQSLEDPLLKLDSFFIFYINNLKIKYHLPHEIMFCIAFAIALLNLATVHSH